MRATLFSAVLFALLLIQNTPTNASHVLLIAGGGERTYGWQDTHRSYGRAAIVIETAPSTKGITFGTVAGCTAGRNSFTVGNADYYRLYVSLYAHAPFMGGALTVSGSFGPVKGSYSIYGSRGKTDTESFDFSALYSRKIPINGFWMEPQVLLLLARVNGNTSIADSGAVTQQEDFDRMLGRLQFSIGKDFSKGSAWIRAACAYDLRGELKVKQTIGDRHPGHSISLGGSWWRAGIGVSYKYSKNTSFFASFDKLWGGNVGADWQFAVGIHMDF